MSNFKEIYMFIIYQLNKDNQNNEIKCKNNKKNLIEIIHSEKNEKDKFSYLY